MQVETAVDEALWFHDENYEPPWLNLRMILLSAAFVF